MGFVLLIFLYFNLGDYVFTVLRFEVLVMFIEDINYRNCVPNWADEPANKCSEEILGTTCIGVCIENCEYIVNRFHYESNKKDDELTPN